MVSINNVPIRRCIACGKRQPKENFLMIVRPPKSCENFHLDLLNGDSKKIGRGYYICKCADCVKSAKKFRRIERLFSKIKNVNFENLYSSLNLAVGDNE